jgi:glycosyltransferase involved in cell wall biosynthesis
MSRTELKHESSARRVSSPSRVAWVAEIPVPYRLGLYRRLQEPAGGIDLKMMFCAATQADRDWAVSLEGIPHVLMWGVTVPVQPGKQFFLRINPQVWRELSRFRPDVVVVGGYAHVTMQLAMLWCRSTATPYVINSESHARGRDAGAGIRNLGNEKRGYRSRMLPRLYWPLVVPLRHLARLVKRHFISGAAAGLPAGSLAREYLVSHGGPAERMFHLPNTCDVDWFSRESSRARSRRAALRAELGLGRGPVVLYVGRLVPVKGIDTLLRAFRLVEPRGRSNLAGPSTINREPSNAAQLLIVGEGEQRGDLEALASELALEQQVRFIGSRPWAELPRLYGIADLLVLPSLFEPWGAVVNEALACGLPVVVSDQVGCAPDLVRAGENGWIVSAGDTGALAAALEEALADPQRLARMGASSARLAPDWGEDACLKAFLAAIAAARAT